MTLGEALAGRNNALNAIRLLLAMLVVTSHAWPLGNGTTDPTIASYSLGGWAVAGFFTISGYLIPASRTRQSPHRYAYQRAARIFPGLWVCLLFTAVVLAPLAALTTHTRYDQTSAITYIARNLTASIGQRSIGTSLDHLSHPEWNGALWTLFYELCCYVLAGVLLSIPLIRRHQTSAAAAIFVLAVLGSSRYACWFLSFFAAGWIVRSLGDRIKPSWTLVVAATAAVVLTSTVAVPIRALPLAVLLLCLGVVAPIRWFSVNDISYGTYLYGFPTQQLLALLGVPALGLAAYWTSSVALALALGTASWFVVERRFLPRGQRARARVAAPAAVSQPA